MASDTHHVTVIGAGIVGIACAAHLLRDGHRVTVVDRLAPGEGTSLGSAGALVSGAVVPASTPGLLTRVPKMLFDPLGPLSIRWQYLPRVAPWLYQYARNSSIERVERIADALTALLDSSVEEHQLLARGTAAQQWLRPTPYLYLYSDEAAYIASAYSWRLRRERHIRFQVIGDGELHERIPALSPDIRYAVSMDDYGFSPDPLQLVRALADDVTCRGGTILRREILDLEIGANGPTRLLADHGDLDIEVLVIAAGAWSGKLTRRLGDPVPLEAERGYQITVQNSGIDLPMPVQSTAGKFVVTPMAPGLRFSGLAEFAGLEAPPNYARAQTLLVHAQRMFPGIDTSTHTQWMGHRPSLPDSLPVIGRSTTFPSVYYAFGHQHVGLTAGPRTGRLIAELISGRTPNIDLDPFRVNRF